MAGNEITRSFSEEEALSSRGHLAPGTAAGEYVVTELVARGGCGSVYRARHRSHDREAAVKVLHASLAAQPKMVERFTREVQVLNLLRHPNIIEIYDIGSLPDGRPYYTMEYLSGRTLATVLAARGRLPPGEVVELLRPVCAALQAAHDAGVIHRDVKASNIMVADGDRHGVKLVDFGIAKLLLPPAEGGGLTSEGRQVGTLTIMAPEQLLGGPIGPRTDVYALGILLFRLLTGGHAFDARSPLALAQQHLEQPAPRPSDRTPLSPALDAIVLRCLEKRPEHRYASVMDFLDALRGAVGRGLGAPSRGSYALVTGVAVYLEIRTRAVVSELEEAMSEDVGAILETGEDALLTHGFVLALATGSQVLGVRLLPTEPAEAIAVRARAIDTAAALRRRLDARAGAHRDVHVNVCVHAAEVAVRKSTQLEVLGGPLTRVDQWAPSEDVEALCGTPEVLDGLSELSELDLTPGPGALARIASRTT